MKIGPQKTAALVYELTLANNGSSIEKIDENQPAMFKFGINQLLPKFEENLSGLETGNEFDFILKADDAYGPVDPYAIFDIPKETFIVDGKIDQEAMQVGNMIPMQDDEGNKHMGVIKKILEETVSMDFNHPLAGKDLRFKGKVIEVKDN